MSVSVIIRLILFGTSFQTTEMFSKLIFDALKFIKNIKISFIGKIIVSKNHKKNIAILSLCARFIGNL